MRILWISFRIFDDKEIRESGAWQKALAIKLAKSDKIVLGNIAKSKEVAELTKCDYNNIQQWAFPAKVKIKKGYPDKTTQLRFEKVLEAFKPDIIQVWGSENFLKLLPFSSKYQEIKILNFQGVLASIAPVFLQGLSFWERLSTIGIQELYYRRNLFSTKRSFEIEGEIESEMINKAGFILSHSEWVDSQIRSVNNHVKIYRTHRSLRSDFLVCKKWTSFQQAELFIFSMAIGYPYKGLHTLLKALNIVKKIYPNVKLRIAGATGRKDILGAGYIRLLMRIIKKYDLHENVVWLGPLTAKEIISNFQNSAVYVHSSYADSYPNAVAEAMIVGIPSVITAIGGIPELAKNGKEALFYAPHDYKNCAYLICKLFSDKLLSESISKNAIARAEIRNKSFNILNEQIDIYSKILKTKTSQVSSHL